MTTNEHAATSAARGVAVALALLLGGAATLPAAAEPARGWLPTWSASPQPVWGPDFLAPVGIPRALRDQTLRQVARVSLGGHRCGSGSRTSTAPRP